MKTTNSHRMLWFTRRDGIVRGPYPGRQVSRYILLGRIRESDEVKPEEGEWAGLSVYPELIPEVMKLPPSEENLEKLLIARMREDERQPGDRRERQSRQDSEGFREKRSGSERRREESEEELRHRLLRYRVSHQTHPGRKVYRYPLVASVLVIFGLALSYVMARFEPEPVAPDCAARARPGVNWNNCNQAGLVANRADLIGASISNARMDTAQLSGAKLAGANLEYSSLNLSNLRRADLSHARLVGVALRGADLRNSNLAQADLSYANLSGASIEGANFSGAILDNAIWVDQKPCVPGSTGVCKRYRKK
ncbi:MAG: pentapeptide repeat-containing protein [Thiogranum sp.]